MHIFIANATHQVVSFLYRVPEQPALRNQHIPVGGQIRLPEDLSSDAVEYVLNQHRKYGLVPVDEITRVREFKGMCYSIDKPIAAGRIEALMNHNQNELVKLGKKLREEAALTSNQELENDLLESGRPEILRNLEVSVVEENHDDRDPTPPVAEGFRVERQGENQFGPDRQPQQQQQQRRRR